MKTIRLFVFLICFGLFVNFTNAQGTAFTYQGRLNDGAGPANGVYDLRFTIYDASSGGATVAGPITLPTTSVSNGLFTVTLDTGAGVFNGSARWIGIEVRTNGASSFVTLNPRQQTASTPYAITASNLTGTVSSSSLSGTYSNPLSLLNGNNVFSGALFSGSFSGNGSGLTSLNAAQLTGTVPDSSLAPNIARTNQTWLVNGNSGTSPASGNFFGTVDQQPLELKVGGLRALRVEPDPRAGTFSANLMGGYTNNAIEQPNSGGNVIAGGGLGGVAANVIHSNSANNFIGAAWGAQIGPNVNGAVVGSGYFNIISNGATFSFIGAGYNNAIGGYDSFIGGGRYNYIQSNAIWSVIAGGTESTIGSNASFGTIGGGAGNYVLESASTIAGGQQNYIHQSADHAFIGGGFQNHIYGSPGPVYSAISGGYSNIIQTNVGYGFIGGGATNSIGNNAQYAVIGGGAQNLAAGVYSTISGGQGGSIGTNSYFDSIGGGGYNSIGTNMPSTTIAGGYFNTIGSSGADSAIGGGSFNNVGTNVSFGTISGGRQNKASDNAYAPTIAGGYANTISPAASYTTIGGGNNNFAANAYSTIPGGLYNFAYGYGSFAAGTYAQALNLGSFVWGDASTTTPTSSSANNQFTVRAMGGVRFITGGAGISVDGVIHEQAVPNNTNVSNIVNVVDGSSANYVGSGVNGGVVAGGGASQYYGSSTGSNTVTADFGTVSGGLGNSATAAYATVPGGSFNNAGGTNSFAAGHRAKAVNDGAFVWADTQEADFTSTGTNQMLVRASGGVGINTNNPGSAALNVNGTVAATAFKGDGSQLSNLNVGALGNFVFAYTGTTQVPAAANTYQDIPLNTDAQIAGWTHTSGSAQYINNQTGIYMINYTASGQATAAAGTNMTLHATLNGSEIGGSRVSINTIGIQLITAGRSVITSATSGDVVTLQFLGSSTSCRLIGTPSVSMTITRLQ